jgi:signal transduction histidine kinase
VKGPSYNGAIAPGSNGNGHGYSAGDGYGHPALRDPQSPDDEYDTAGFALHLPPFPISQFDPQSGCPPGDRNPGAWKATEIDLDSIRHEMLSVVTQLRGLIGELRPPGLDEFGVVTAIEGYVSKLRRDAQTGSRPMPDVFLDLPAENTDLPRPVALCLFRTTQEAVRNALKHANSTCIDVHLRVEPDGVVLSVVDDGDGFKVPTNFSKLAQDDHYGLIGMAERVEWVNGRLTIDSQSGHGTELTVWIPLPN